VNATATCDRAAIRTLTAIRSNDSIWAKACGACFIRTVNWGSRVHHRGVTPFGASADAICHAPSQGACPRRSPEGCAVGYAVRLRLLTGRMSEPRRGTPRVPAPSTRRHARVKPALAASAWLRAAMMLGRRGALACSIWAWSRSAVFSSCRASVSRLRLGLYFVRHDDHRTVSIGREMPRNATEDRRHPSPAPAAAHDNQVNSPLLGEFKQSPRWLARLRE
jgi:hypothetical protein